MSNSPSPDPTPIEPLSHLRAGIVPVFARPKNFSAPHTSWGKRYALSAGLTVSLLLSVVFRLSFHGDVPPSLKSDSALPHDTGGASAPTPGTVSSHMSLTDDPVIHRLPAINSEDISRRLSSAWDGNARSQFTLGIAFEMGEGAEQSCVRAASWMARAADQGYAPAEYNLGLRFWGGDGVWVDRTQSIHWLQRAAKHGHVQAAVRLKELLEKNK